jgi:argininosuccinate lyase
MADYLAAKGMPFREAHAVVGRLVLKCEQEKKALDELSLAQLREASELFTDDIYEAIAIPTCVAARNTVGGPAPEAVRRMLDLGQAWLANKSSKGCSQQAEK